MQSKQIFNPASKTHWTSAATMVTGGVLMMAPGLKDAVDPTLFAWILFGVGLTNHILRNITDTAIDEK